MSRVRGIVHAYEVYRSIIILSSKYCESQYMLNFVLDEVLWEQYHLEGTPRTALYIQSEYKNGFEIRNEPAQVFTLTPRMSTLILSFCVAFGLTRERFVP